jgi:hypothetical protein
MLGEYGMQNNDLTEVFARKDLRAYFKGGDLDPWWWPRAPGRRPEDWGLAQGELPVYYSLRGDAPETGRNGYEGFVGSVAAGKGCAWLLSIRPSRGTFPRSVHRIHTALLLEDAARLGIAELHVTDLIKFRGPTSARKSEEGMTDEMFRISVECLLEEHRATAPERILMVDSALRKLVQSRSRLSPQGDLCRRWEQDSLGRELNSFLHFLRSKGVPVPHWQGDPLAFNAAIARELSGSKMRIPLPTFQQSPSGRPCMGPVRRGAK